MSNTPITHWFPDDMFAPLSDWYKDKKSTIRRYVEIMLCRTAQMFVYQNLPRSMSPVLLETWLQSYGQLCIARLPSSSFLGKSAGTVTVNTDALVPLAPIEGPGVDIEKIVEDADKATSELTGSSAEGIDDLYFFTCSSGGKTDIYYRPTICVVANPLFKESHTFTIGRDCVLMKNDIFSQGLLPTLFRYAKEYTEADITIISTFLNSRIRTILEASEGPELESAQQFLRDIEAGKMSAITSRPLLEGLKVWNDNGASSASILAQVIEGRQALQVAWYNELGIDPNFSLKREYVSAEEIGSNTDLLMPLVDHMLVCRKDAIDQINAMFGTNIEVEKASAWAHKSRMAQSNAVLSAQDETIEGGENDNENKNDVSSSSSEETDSAE